MNRCNALFHPPLARRMLMHALLAMSLAGLGTMALAQNAVRNFPPRAERGVMLVTYPPIVQMNGKPDRLSPGARIRGDNNMLLLSGSIVGQSLVVNFVRNATGDVHDVWVLTPAETALKLPKQQ